MESVTFLWWLVLLLALQGVLATARAVITRSQWGYDAEEQMLRRDITQLSIALDLGLLLLAGAYFAVGISRGYPLLRRRLVERFTAETATWFVPLSSVLYALLLGWLNLALGYLLPEALGYSLSDGARRTMTSLGQSIYVILKPLSLAALGISDALARALGARPLQRVEIITEDEIKTLITAGQQEGIIEEDEREMLYSIFQLGDTVTREVMVPRTDIVAMEVNTPMNEVIETIVRSGHSRIPVYAETIDNIVGILYVKDLLQYQNAPTPAPVLGEILRPAYFIPESKRLDILMRELQVKKVQLSMVVDEYGGIAGLVTLEDIVEEIVGEIQDEYDREEPEVVQLEDGSYLFDARIPLDDVQELLGISLPLEETDSLGGFVYNELGHIPFLNERFTYTDVLFEVVEVEGRRIRKVRTTTETTITTEEVETL